jgi:hypothetical protein
MSLLTGIVVRVVLVALLMLGGYAAGRYQQHEHDQRAAQAAERMAEQKAREIGQAAQRAADAAAASYAEDQNEKQRKASDEIARLQTALAGMPRCTVPGAVVRVLDPVPSPGPDAGPAPGTGEPATPPDSTCGLQLEIAARNYREVCEPNADQLRALQRLWTDTKARLDAGG